ncbi:hypothetical protein C4J81_15435 [Deltaproteobacteria bacterium Smac51]|nr:hypothetical protein C4J81_10170 [Deltaproteobacteria bacterium Smac51]UQZ90523.1 hypothetical protein C4J81_15435 [Deltaproteobacteria bacterium Smac51]
MSNFNWIIAAGFFGAFLYVCHLQSENDDLAARLTDSGLEIRSLQIELEEEREAGVARDKYIRQLKTAGDHMSNQLEGVYEKNSEARAWADAVCPDDVFECLLTALPDGAADESADSLSSGRGGTAPARADQR